MSRLIWDKIGEKFYETGVEKGVFYPFKDGAYNGGVAWSGIISVSENPSGGEPTGQYADNIKYVDLMSKEEFAATIEAYTYPKEFEVCDGSAEIAKGISIGQQPRLNFGFSYQTKVGNDTESENHGYKIHIIYNAKAAPSQKQYQTVGENVDAITFSWSLSTTPVPVEGYNPTATLTIDSRTVDKETLAKLEDILYGSEDGEARLPLPDEVIDLVGAENIEEIMG